MNCKINAQIRASELQNFIHTYSTKKIQQQEKKKKKKERSIELYMKLHKVVERVCSSQRSQAFELASTIEQLQMGGGRVLKEIAHTLSS